MINKQCFHCKIGKKKNHSHMSRFHGMKTHLIWIELSFADRRLESSGGSNLHRASASSKLPDAVN